MGSRVHAGVSREGPRTILEDEEGMEDSEGSFVWGTSWEL